MNNKMRLFQGCLHLIVATIAIYGGLAAILDPAGQWSQIVDTTFMMEPFQDHLLPGLLLFSILGIGNLLAAAIDALNWWFYPYISVGLGIILMIWLGVERMLLSTFYVTEFWLLGLAISQIVLGYLSMKKLAILPKQLGVTKRIIE